MDLKYPYGLYLIRRSLSESSSQAPMPETDFWLILHHQKIPMYPWCRENNHGYARTAKEFREQLAGYLGGTFADVTTRQKGNTYYKDFTITEETKELYAKEYGYEETEFLAG